MGDLVYDLTPKTQAVITPSGTGGAAATPSPAEATKSSVALTDPVLNNQLRSSALPSIPIAATAGSPNGLKEIKLLANNQVVKTCEFQGEKTEQTCKYDLPMEGFKPLDLVEVHATSLDTNDGALITRYGYYLIVDTVTYRGIFSSSANSNASTAGTLSRDITFQQAFTVGLGENKIANVDIYVNGKVVKSCPGNGATSVTCQADISTADYGSTTFLWVAAKYTAEDQTYGWTMPVVYTLQRAAQQP
jgi:hypothetical protein